MKYRFLRFPNGKEKALTLSYDDGCIHDKRLIEIADKYGIKLTLNINSGLMNTNKNDFRLTIDELKKLTEKGGHEIAVHGAFHKAPGLVSSVDCITDVLLCRRDLENAFGKIIRGMAYPDSGITKISPITSKDEIKKNLKALGIAYARTLGGDNDRFALPNDFYEWMPTAHHQHPQLLNWLENFKSHELSKNGANRQPKLFYLWGHSFEFHNRNNWELFEEFCQKASGCDNIWYATNIEICDYMNAYSALQFNIENNIVYNPTDKTVWFEADGVTVCVKSGETKKF